MGQRLYPLMRERPPGFRVNPNSPLYRDLKIAPYDPAIERWWQDIPTRLGGEWWSWYGGTWYPGDMPYVRWSASWKRHAAFSGPWFSGLRIIPPPSFLLPTEEFSIFWMSSPSVGDTFSVAFGIFDSAVNVKLRAGHDTSRPSATLNGVTLTGHESHQTIVVRYRPGTNQFQFWGNGGLASQSTATLPSWSGTDILWYWATLNDGTNMGFFADLMYWTRYLTDNEIAALSDINNVDFRLSSAGPPLLLPPARKFFPVAVAVAESATAKIPWHLFFMNM